MNTGGLEFYRRFFVKNQLSTDDKHILTQSFLRLEQLTSYFAENTYTSCSIKSIHDLRMANMHRAVLASLNNKDLYTIIEDYLQQKITINTAVNNVLVIINQQPITITSNSQ